jgi:hypothetical protein
LGKFLKSFNYVAIISGLFISLLITIILKFFIGSLALFLLPLMASIISVFLANESEYINGITTGLLAGLISIIWIGPFFLLLGPLGGFLGVLLNKYLNKSNLKPTLGKKNAENRLYPINNIINNLKLNKTIIVIAAVLLGIILIWGVFTMPTIEESPIDKDPVINNTTENNQTLPNPEDVTLRQNLTKSLELFFSNFNLMFKENGVSNGYILNTIQIVSLNKTSANQVQITVNLTRIPSNGGQFNSVWNGPFYLVNGTWVDKGEFVQIHSYNSTSGKDTL